MQTTVSALSSRVQNVNTTDLLGAIRLGCRTMGGMFNPVDGVPYFRSTVWPRAELSFHHLFSEAHVPGRHLNALVSAKTDCGVKVDDDVIDRHAKAAFFSFSGPVALPLNRKHEGDSAVSIFLPHNVREGFHALYALVRDRDDDRARALAERCIGEINTRWTPDTGWDVAGLAKLGIETLHPQFSFGLARSIGPLVKYFQLTGYTPAMDLARRLALKVTDEILLADGSYDAVRCGSHVHSTTCTLSSIAQLAEATNDTALFARVEAFMNNGLHAIADYTGWSIECTDQGSSPDRGECNNSGDIVETALALARREGADRARWFGVAERMLRSHLLPSQLRDVLFIPESPQDGETDQSIAERHVGAFGFPAPYGHAPRGHEEINFNTDIVGGTVDSLCAAASSALSVRGDEARIHLLFDADSPDIAVRSPYPDGILTVSVKRPMNVFVRVPEGVTPMVSQNGYASLGRIEPGRSVTIRLRFLEREITLKHIGAEIRARFRGESLIAIDNLGQPLAFFDPIDDDARNRP